jgi:hypothetical protein
MIPEYFIYFAVLANLMGGVVYLKDTLIGRAKPNRVTWLLWAIAPLIGFAAQIKAGVGLSSAMTFIVGFTPLLVFISSFFNIKSRWNLTAFDLVCGALSILGLILWIITNDPILAISFSILADGLAALPTIKKSFYHPESESEYAFLGGTISGAITTLALTRYDLANLGFPLYIFLVNGVLFLLIKFKLGLKLAKLS